MGKGVIAFLFGGGGRGELVRCRGIIKEKYPDYRSPEVGISGYGDQSVTLSTNISC